MADAIVVSSLPYTNTVDTTEATVEIGEPIYTCAPVVGATVWYSYTPAASGVFVINTNGSDFDTMLNVFDASTMSLVDCNGASGDGLSSFLFIEGSAGTTYLISGGGYGEASGSLVVNIYHPGLFTTCAAVDVPQAECEALVSLYDSTGGDSWTANDNWKNTDMVCTWKGVSCRGDWGDWNVELLDLNYNNLNGPLVDLSTCLRCGFLMFRQSINWRFVHNSRRHASRDFPSASGL